MEWVRKYRPVDSSGVQGQDKAVSELKNAVETFKKGSKPILLHGPPGTGKTCSAYAVANELNLEVVEVNASDARNKASINSLLGGAIAQQSLFSKGKLILVDEVDGISGTKDRGGLPAVIDLAGNSSFPIVITANDVHNKKFSGLRKKCLLLEFGNLNYLSINKKLKEIAAKEGVKASEDALKALARKAQGDMRAAINDLQALTQGSGKLDKEDIEVMDDRQRKESIVQALLRVFKTTDAKVAREAYNEVDADLDEIFLWIEQNIPLEYKKPLDLSRALENLAVADKFYGRIRRWQHYRFYVYCYDLLSAGIALSKDEKYPGFTKYQRSSKPLKIWMSNNKLAKKKGVAAKMAVATHHSAKQAMHQVLYFRAANKNKDFIERVSEAFELDDDEAVWLRA